MKLLTLIYMLLSYLLRCECCGSGYYRTCNCGCFLNIGCCSNLYCETCNTCENGYYCPGDNQRYACQDLKCNIGQYLEGCGGSSQGNCMDCNPGTFADTQTLLTCAQCPSGTFSNMSAATSCIECEAGKFAADGISIRLYSKNLSFK